MAVLNLIPGATAVELTVNLKPYVITPAVTEAPGGLYPLMSSSWEMDEYRIMNGWPVSVPGHDIHANSILSCEGLVLTGRDDPNAVQTGAFLRWVADATFFDEDALVWRPTQGPPDALWETSVEFAPVLIDDYEYRVENEKFVMTALNFDSDTANHMWQDFSNVLTGVAGYTVILVLSPNSAFGNDAEVPYNGLWCPGRETPPDTPSFTEEISDTWMSVTLQGNFLYLETESIPRTPGVPCAPSLNNTRPSYLALSFARPQTTLYMATGPDNITSKALATGADSASMDYGVLLGRSTGDVGHTADMALFDVGIYANVLTAAQIKDEFALLSRAYGGDK